MLWHDPDQSGHRQGLLIDFDYASKISHQADGDYSLGHRTVSHPCQVSTLHGINNPPVMQGTGPFMAYEVLFSADNQHIKQKPAHDLESMFYVLLFICTCFMGPDRRKRTVEEFQQLSSMPILRWFERHKRYRELADLKFSHLSTFSQHFKSKITPYFLDLWPLLEGLWDILFPPPPGMSSDAPRSLVACCGTHDKLLEAFRTSYKSLPEADAHEAPGAAPSAAPDAHNDLSPFSVLPWVVRSRKRSGENTPPSPTGSASKRIHPMVPTS